MREREKERNLRSCAYKESPEGERTAKKKKKQFMLNCDQQLQRPRSDAITLTLWHSPEGHRG